MTEFKDVPADVAHRARVVIQIAEHTDALHAAEILTPWVKEDPQGFVEVLLAVALMADKDKRLKEAHAAYVRGDRTPSVVTLEREYQRLRAQRKRSYRTASVAPAGREDVA